MLLSYQFTTFQKREKLEEDLAFFQAEIKELQIKKEASEMFENKVAAQGYAKDIEEITATINRMERDLARIDQEHAYLTPVVSSYQHFPITDSLY